MYTHQGLIINRPQFTVGVVFIQYKYLLFATPIVAHLCGVVVEHCVCDAKDAGSNPAPADFFSFFFSSCYGYKCPHLN